MKAEDPNAAALRRYLLALSTPAEREQIERRLLAEPAFFHEVSAAEDELADDYVAGRLSPAEREGFESVFLSAPERRTKLAFAQALRRYLQDPDAARRPSPHTDAPRTDAPIFNADAHAFDADARASDVGASAFDADARGGRVPARAQGGGGLSGFFARATTPARAALAFALLFCLGGLGWLAFEAARREQAPARPAHGDATAENSAPADRSTANSAARGVPPAPAAGGAETQITPSQTDRAVLKAPPLTLAAGMTRAVGPGGMKPVKIPEGAEILPLHLRLEDDAHAYYRAVVQTVEGRDVTTQPGVRGSEPLVVVEVPTAPLTPGDYRVELYGLDATGPPEQFPTYFFRVLAP